MHHLFQPSTYPAAKKVWETVRNIANEIKREPIEVAVAWVLKQENIFTAIVGSRNPEQVEEFASAADLELNLDQLSRLTESSNMFPAVKAREWRDFQKLPNLCDKKYGLSYSKSVKTRIFEILLNISFFAYSSKTIIIK